MKLKKPFLLLSSVSAIPAVVLTVSAETETSASANDSNNTNNNSTAPRAASNLNLQSAAATVRNIQVAKLTDLFNTYLPVFEQQANAFLGSANSQGNDLVRGFYLNKVVKYLKAHKDQIINNPVESGFLFYYPRTISSNQSFQKVFIKYLPDNPDYYFKNVVSGSQTDVYAPDNLPEFLKIKPASVETSSQDADSNSNIFPNEFTISDISDIVSRYYLALSEQFEEILLNFEDIPKIGEGGSTKIVNKATGRFDLEVPDGYDDWEQYIKDRFALRTLLFDLKFNSTNEQVDDNPAIKDPAITQQGIDHTADLVPYISTFQFEKFQSLKSADEIATYINAYNADAKVNSDTYFYFNNLFNTRYQYSVSRLSITEQNEFIADVVVKDKLSESVNRQYRSVVKIKDSKQLTTAWQATTNTLNAVIKQLYESAGVGANLNYKKVSNQQFADAFYDFVNKLTVAAQTEDFNTKVSQIVQENSLVASSISGLSNLSNTLGQQLIDYLLDIVSNIEVSKQINVYQLLVNLETALTTHLISEFKKPENISKVQANIDVVRELYEESSYPAFLLIERTLRFVLKDTEEINKLVNAEILNYDQYREFQLILKRIKFMNQSLNSILTTPTLTYTKDTEDAEVKKQQRQEISKLLDLYWGLPEFQYNPQKTSKAVLTILSTVLMVISALAFVLLGAFALLRKRWNIANTKQKVIIGSVFTTVTFVIALILLILGKGLL
ncbi:MSC_0620 family F1-like ATPase-associated subunit [Mycoplasma nasistruthionis]|uniref:Uncharacterized protein n=1 Tax=Mycoplasma nasistruthionis TaxID=353852 RepID=A0A4Y6I6L0_9MOLU|nr:hypothetical protein [Mycoplasma nasistruthionis]QDF65022.1 hypothetical protein FIV53_01770 [Mycoplasma nasistruthionis]